MPGLAGSWPSPLHRRSVPLAGDLQPRRHRGRRGPRGRRAAAACSRSGRAPGRLPAGAPARRQDGRRAQPGLALDPLCLLFLAPFVDPRRPLRLLHLDLLVLLSFGVAQLLFNAGELDLWVPAVYPVLGYLLVRLLLAGFRPRERTRAADPLRQGCVAARRPRLVLVVGRIVLNLVDSDVIDVGYASVVGGASVWLHGQGDRRLRPAHFPRLRPVRAAVARGRRLGHGSRRRTPPPSPSTCSPCSGWCWSGRGMRTGREGRTLGLALGYAWVPSLLDLRPPVEHQRRAGGDAARSTRCWPWARPRAAACVVGLAAAAKFFPLALAPLFATGTGDRRPGSLLRFGAAFVVVCVGRGGAVPARRRAARDVGRHMGYQLGREAPFSLWGLHPSLGWLQDVLQGRRGPVLRGAGVRATPARCAPGGGAGRRLR